MTTWRKASFSDGQGQCVEVADLGELRGVRDSKQGDASPVLAFSRDAFRAFVDEAKAGGYDDLV